MKLHDIHVHTHLSDCARRDAFMKDYLDAAAEIGLEVVGFADHAWDEKVEGVSEWYRPQTYSRLEQRREEIKTVGCRGVKVLLGAEGEYGNFLLGLGEDAMQYVDYVIVPHSHTHMKELVLPPDCVGEPRKHAKYILDSFMGLCRHKNRNLFFGIAHPMFPCGEKGEYFKEIYKYISDADLRECLTAAKETGLFLEANLSCMASIGRGDGHEEYKRYFDACREVGNDMFLGTDAHAIDSFKFHHGEKAKILEMCGMNDDRFFAKADEAIKNM